MNIASYIEHKLLKEIIETAYLSDLEIEQACKICEDAGADFVKTSTGFAPKGGFRRTHYTHEKKITISCWHQGIWRNKNLRIRRSFNTSRR